MVEPVFHHILVPTDGSEHSVHAAQLAFRLAQLHRARVTLLYVVDEQVVEELDRLSAHDHSIDGREDLHAQGLQYLAFLENLARNCGLEVNVEVREGEPYEEIVALAGAAAVELIVIGHVGRRGPRRVLIGSVTERVMEFAACPVLVVKD
jgi:nucleotide-binding universal stress UspA family protein